MEPKTEGLSISEAYDSALAEGQGDGTTTPNPDESANPQPASPDANGQPKPAEPKPTEAKLDKDGKPVEQKPANPAIDPDNAKYSGEYSKERFDGLMSAWQKDRTSAKLVPELQKSLEELKKQVETIQNPQPKGDIDLPPELQSADPETQAGFKLLMKAQEGKLSNLEEKILSRMMDTMNKPLKEQNEIVTKVQQEVETLSVELGKNFADNAKEVKKYAADNNYPLGTLKLAYQAWLKDKELSGLKTKMSGGKKTLDEIEAERARQGELPQGSANRSSELPKWDEKRDGGKTIADLMDDVQTYL